MHFHLLVTLLTLHFWSQCPHFRHTCQGGSFHLLEHSLIGARRLTTLMGLVACLQVVVSIHMMITLLLRTIFPDQGSLTYLKECHRQHHGGPRYCNCIVNSQDNVLSFQLMHNVLPQNVYLTSELLRAFLNMFFNGDVYP